MSDESDRLLATRSQVFATRSGGRRARRRRQAAASLGFACNIPVRGKFIYEPSISLMQNRGNAKGGGIAAPAWARADRRFARGAWIRTTWCSSRSR